MVCGIYKITNTLNNKSYIGQSINIEERWRREKSRAFQTNQPDYHSTLSRAFRKYGIQNFTFEILEECTELELDSLEQKYIQLYDTYFSGYNETLGGQNKGGFGNSYKLSKIQLLEIYELLQHSNLTQNEIAQKYSVGKDVISTINHGKNRQLPGYTYPLRDNSAKIKLCAICNRPISPKASLCMECNRKQTQKSERPTRVQLKEMIRNMPFTAIGKKFGVSDNSIRKWCDAYNLPVRKKDIKAYSDEEWEQI